MEYGHGGGMMMIMRDRGLVYGLLRIGFLKRLRSRHCRCYSASPRHLERGQSRWQR
jgi:hypothetical protein